MGIDPFIGILEEWCSVVVSFMLLFSESQDVLKSSMWNSLWDTQGVCLCLYALRNGKSLTCTGKSAGHDCNIFYVKFFYNCRHGSIKVTGFLSIPSSAVKRLIASKIKVFVCIIYVCVLCIFIMYILGVARYTYRTVRFTGQIPNGSDHPYPLGVGTLEWTEHVRAIILSLEMHLAKRAI